MWDLFHLSMSPNFAGLVLQLVACSLIPIMMLGNDFHFSFQHTYCMWVCIVPTSGMGSFFMYLPLEVNVTCSYSHIDLDSIPCCGGVFDALFRPSASC